MVSYKSQHKVCFRFFDGEFCKNCFVSENGNVPDSWEGVAQQLDANKIFYTKRKIEEHREYRDILYGNHDGKKNELKRYSILESKDYQYIPKTIQNVFLNSKMEAEFIKQTIIMSLENDFRIDLNQHAHHLNGFETQLSTKRRHPQVHIILIQTQPAKEYALYLRLVAAHGCHKKAQPLTALARADEFQFYFCSSIVLKI